MGEQPVVLAVAAYASKAGAEQDLGALAALAGEDGPGPVVAAVLEKGGDGLLEVERQECIPSPVVWSAALLGAAVVVVAPPVGIALLAGVLATSAAWAGAGAVVGHFWHHIPKDQLRKMADLVEAGQAALVVVGVGHRGEDLDAVLSHCTTKVVGDTTSVDLGAEFDRAVHADGTT